MKDLKLGIPFDQFGRYYFISKIVESNRKSKKSLKILDVGGYGGSLRDFLPNDNITILDVFDVNESGYIKGSGLDIEFADKSFDIVCSADTLEHIPAEKRDLFLSECYRVSKDFLIIAAPFETGKTAEAEDFANNVYAVLSGYSYIWLKEHKEYGLPNPDRVKEWATKNNLKYFVLLNNNIEEWKELISQFFVLDNLPSVKGNKYFLNESKQYNLTSNQFQAEDPAYRHVYVFSKRPLIMPDLPKKSFSNSSMGVERLLRTIKFYIDEQDNRKITDFEFRKIKLELGFVNEIEPRTQNKDLQNRLFNAESELNKIRSSLLLKIYRRIYSNKLLSSFAKVFSKIIKSILKLYRYRLYFYPPNLIWRLKTQTPPYVKEDINNLRFKTIENPQVSIIVPIYGKATTTLECLKSLAKHSSKYTFEVILIDDKSPDKSKKLFEKIPGLIFHSNPVNKGFIYSCNKGADLARGKYLVFLNNDTIVLDDWLTPLINRLASDDSVGLVGSKIIYPNGVLQEAGGIIFSDGSGWNYGRGENPDNFEFNYAREVDYCSGASIAIPKELFNNLGKFNTIYSPAYYEDTDLAFSVRESGLKVIYEPLSKIIHKEGVTSGTDITGGVKRYQAINQKKFVKRWGKVLKENHYASSNYLFYAKERSSDLNVLIIDHYVPEFDKDSGSVRMTGLIKIMKDLGYRVTLWPQNLIQTQPYTNYFQNLGVRVIYGDVNFIEYSRQYANYYDLVIVSRPTIAPIFLDAINSYYQRAKIIYDTVDLSFLRIKRLAEIDNNSDYLHESEKLKGLELGVMQRVDATIVVSEVEKNILAKESPSTTVAVVSNIHTLKPPSNKTFSEREGLIFIGGFNHPPNIDAVLWFSEFIYPLILKKYPKLILNIVGSNPPTSILDLTSKNIKVWGYVENVDNLFNTSKVFIAPIRYGAGVKGKIGQAAEYGLPVVSTDIGIEGMHMRDSLDCLVANSDHDFADSVIRLLGDEQLWQQISNNSRLVISKYFSPESAKKALKNLLDSL